jgi:RNA polymerase sigma factor (sigma-70 family)
MPSSHDRRRSDIRSTSIDGTRSLPPLDVDEERRQARHLHELRRACWKVVLTEPALAERFLALTHEQLGPAVPESLATWETGAPASEALASTMLKADPYGYILARLDTALVPDEGPHAQRLRLARGEYLRARNRFICANLRFVFVMAKRYGEHHMALADRVQEGNIGLLKATDRFDPELGFRFSTYAAWWIRHTVIRALVKHGRTVRIPSNIHTLFTKARHTRNALRNELGRNPTLAEVAERIDAPLAKVAAAVGAMELRLVGLDEPATGERGRAIGDVLPDEELDGWADRIGERIDARLADAALEGLDDRAFDIVVRRFGLRGAERRSLRSLGEHHHLSRERIRQLQNTALQALRTVLESSDGPSSAVA